MNFSRRAAFCFIAIFTLLLTFAGADQRKAKKLTALDRYVAKTDPNYSYKLVNTIKKEGYTLYVLRMASQKWRNESEVDRTLWEHWLTIAQPDQVTSSTGFLFITGGSMNSKAPDSLT
ncbi:MAG: PhoPQ-activated protein PqaA family protein, partial [Blastocatellia bacterium]